jgi:hypothetical protein
MAFTGPATSRLLLLPDAGRDAVHVIDVQSREHVGYVAAPGSNLGPRGVAARGPLVAVSAWKEWRRGDHVVHVFTGTAPLWTPLRVVGSGCSSEGSSFGEPAAGKLTRPYGVRVTRDGAGVVVTDFYNGRVCRFRVEDGAFERHVTTVVRSPWDVEEVHGGWLVAAGGTGDTIHFVSDGSDSDSDSGSGSGSGSGKAGDSEAPRGVGGSGSLPLIGPTFGCAPGQLMVPTALATMPSLGLVVVREWNSARIQVFGTVDGLAMARMSCLRVAWMAAVMRSAPFDVLRPPPAVPGCGTA